MSVFELAEQAKLSNVGIVCTMSDVSCGLSTSKTEICEMTAIQAIKAEEARKGGPEERANKIQLLLEAIATDQRDFELAEADLASYEDDDELCEEEVKDFTELKKKSKQAKQVPFEPSKFNTNTDDVSSGSGKINTNSST